ncbi:hypothetical protein F4861DRAFT_540576 [Xylaria intraflava]|nr:hypothetical protein F4861DRAFT_540576 [Xylaria intraflava]
MAGANSQVDNGASSSITRRKQSKTKTVTARAGQQLHTPKSTQKPRPTTQRQRDDGVDMYTRGRDNIGETTDDEDDDDETGVSSAEDENGGDDLDMFLSKNIPAMASATRVDEVTKKRTYVTKTNKEWSVDLKPLYKQLELMARKALLITCDKSLMQNCIDFCFAQFTGVESQWIIELAVRRFRVNCNSWKSRYIRSVKLYIQRLEEKESVLKSVDSHSDLQVYFGKRFSVDMFYTVCGWVYSWIDLESSIKEHPEIRVWCAYVFTEICVCVKHHLNWVRAYDEGKEIKKTRWDWEFILSRFDNLYAGANDVWDEYKIKQLNWLHNANKANRITLSKAEKPILQPKDDEFALIPDASFLAALKYVPGSPRRDSRTPSLSATPPSPPPATYRSSKGKAKTSRPTSKQTEYHNGAEKANVPSGRKRRGNREHTEDRQNTNSQQKKRRETLAATQSKTSGLIEGEDSSSRPRASETDESRSQNILDRESHRVNELLNKRIYNSKVAGPTTTATRDEYDEDFEIEGRGEYGNDEFDDNDDDRETHSDDDDNEAQDETMTGRDTSNGSLDTMDGLVGSHG